MKYIHISMFAISLFMNRFTWVLLLAVCRSFVGKTITGLTIAVYVISFSIKSWLMPFDVNSFKIVLIGGIFFLIGYVIVLVFSPPEFSDSISLNEAVMKQKNIEYERSFHARIAMTESLLARMKLKIPRDMSLDHLKLAEIIIADAKKHKENWKDISAALYLTDLNLRQFDLYKVRMTALFCLSLGLAATAYSTVAGVLKIIVFWISG